MQRFCLALFISAIWLIGVGPSCFAEEASNTTATIARADRSKVVGPADGPIQVQILEAADPRTPTEKKAVAQAKAFLEYQYVEIKDLAKQFLLVIAGFLTLSVTFSEKIVGLATAPMSTKVMLGLIWFSCLIAFGLGGLAIFIVYNAGIVAKAVTLDPAKDAGLLLPGFLLLTYREMTMWSQWVLTAAGFAFSFALLVFVILGLVSLRQKQPADDAPRWASE